MGNGKTKPPIVAPKNHAAKKPPKEALRVRARGPNRGEMTRRKIDAKSLKRLTRKKGKISKKTRQTKKLPINNECSAGKKCQE